MDGRAEYLRVGQIVRPHGIRGAVKLAPLTNDLARFHALDEAYLEAKGEYVPVTVSGAGVNQGSVTLTLSCACSREEAEKLRGLYLCVDRAHAVKLPEGAYFVCDLIGCEVSTSGGKPLGILTEVLETGANDVYLIEGERKLMVPALKKLLRLVDTENGRIVLDEAVLEEVGLFED
ncbi:MAG: Ribosome maturation factor RimM [Firmicutes bacterium ADurb.Bin248]|nr:MAG: Ribosome maturation factor RimM [Firmicutes bacterium ADurb.Bin248]HOF99984.1 ribosome maturation factor RimM [Clostridia bacterium]HPK14462.1 ribosome maturation factor RimM [Clostridia bacterium]